MSEGEQLMTTNEAAERLGISPGRMRQYICEGRLPTRKRGRDHFIDVRDLERLQRRPTGRPRTSAGPSRGSTR